MDLVLKRTYHANGTNGKLMHDQQLVCYTIELPWLQNRNNVSCIPEGRYQVVKRFTQDRGWHLYLPDVPQRSWILFHSANDALKELKGCIAPVSALTSPGLGSSSRGATEKFENLLFDAFEREEEVFITIQKEITMNIIDRVKAPTPKFFKVLRNVGLALAAAGGAILASPITLPAAIVTVGGYLVTGGSVLSAVSQTAVDQNAQNDD